MDPALLKKTLRNVYPVMDRWSHRLATNKEFQFENGDLMYSLVTVGGMAANTLLPEKKTFETQDLDLKLVYHHLLTPEEYWDSFVNYFNRLRTRIMLEIKQEINRFADSHRDQFSNLEAFPSSELFTVGIAYKYPYLIYDQKDTYSCARRFPNMIHMVFSLLYQIQGEESTRSLVDLSMFVNLNNPDYLYQRTLENYLYSEYHQVRDKSSRVFLPEDRFTLDRSVKVRVASVGFIISDLYWMSFLHHREEKRRSCQNKLNTIIEQLKSHSKADVSSIVEQVEPLLRVDPSSEVDQASREKLLGLLQELTVHQLKKRIHVYNHF
jgi:hypothetical protein